METKLNFYTINKGNSESQEIQLILVHADGKEELLKSFSCSKTEKETTYNRLRHLMRNVDTKKYQYLGHYREDSDLSENIFYRNYHSLRKIHKIRGSYIYRHTTISNNELNLLSKNSQFVPNDEILEIVARLSKEDENRIMFEDLT